MLNSLIQLKGKGKIFEESWFLSEEMVLTAEQKEKERETKQLHVKLAYCSL